MGSIRFNTRNALMAGLVGAGYYLGSIVGFGLTYQPYPVSTLWPPNAVLLSALLLVRRRLWWLVLLSAFAAHLAAQVQSDVPILMILCWFVSNSAEALLSAISVLYLIGDRPQFDSFRRVGVFIVSAVFLSPFLTSFLDAGFVVLNGWGKNYWLIWRIRFLSNVLATLTIVPVIVMLARRRVAFIRKSFSWRRVEAGFMVIGLVAVVAFAFGEKGAAYIGNLPALIYAPLPFLLLASVRLGPGWVSISLLITTLLAIWNTIHGRGPFTSGSPIENVLSMQVFLIVMAIPLMFLAAIIQERRRLMGAGRQNEERLAMALNAAQMGTWEWQIPANKIVWSDASKRILGVAGSSKDTTFEYFLNLIHPDDLQTVSSEIQRAIAREGPYEVQFRVIHPDGTFRWIMGKGRVLYDETGHPTRMVGVNMDITKQKREELEIERQRRELVHLARVAILGELSGALAHELNQPLTAILSNAQAALRFLSDGQTDLEEVRDILSDIVKADKRAGEVIRRLRALLRKGESQFQQLDLNEITTEALSLVHSELVTHNVTVTTRLASRPARLIGDRVQLQQVLLNMIVNACEAMIATDPSLRRLEIATMSAEGGFVQVSISDNGSGIFENEYEQMFDPFFTTKSHGLGLGLSICRSIITAHGGRLWATNNPHGGATFHFALPVNKESKHEDYQPHTIRGG